MTSQIEEAVNDVQTAFRNLIQLDADEALAVVTGTFVGACEAYAEFRGNDKNKQISIEGTGSNQRKITIHAVE